MNAGPLTLFGAAGALGLVGLDALLRALRLRTLLPSGKRPSLWRAALVNAWGEAATAVTPARVGGEPARLALLRREGIETPHALGALAAEIAIGWIAIAAGEEGSPPPLGRAGSRRPRPPLRAAMARAAPPLLLLALTAATPLPAQNAVMGSRQLPVEHPAYEYLWRLRTRGYVPQLNPLVQPYRRLDVARALANLDPDSLPAPAAHWTRWLHREFTRELESLAGHDAAAALSAPQAPAPSPTTERPEPGAEGPGAQPTGRGPQTGSREPAAQTHNPGRAGRNPPPVTPNSGGGFPNSASAGIELRAGLRGSTSQRLDPLRPLGGAGLWPRYELDAWAGSGPLVLATGLTGDMYFWDDPDGLNPDQRRGGRSDNAYLALALPFGELALGRFRRNWGPPAAPGLMVSALPTSYPQVGLEARLGRFTLRSFTAELDTLRGAKRYLAAHRIDYEAPDLVLSFGESILYAGGPGTLSLRYANPLAFLFFDQGKRPHYEENLTLDAQFWYRTGGTTLYGEFLLDDFEIMDPPEDREPLQYAFTAGLRLTSLAPSLELGIEYRQVGAWTYRTVAGIERYVYLRRGLGENYVDFDRITVCLDAFPAVEGLRLSPLVQLQRQGVQDLRGPDLVGFRWEDSAAVFTGETQTTVRTGLRGRYSPSPNFWLVWDAGWNATRNAGHTAGRSRSAFEATATLGITLPFRPPQPRRSAYSPAGDDIAAPSPYLAERTSTAPWRAQPPP